MTKSLEEAAEEYAYRGMNEIDLQKQLAFRAGAQWGIRQSPEVLALVEALKAISMDIPGLELSELEFEMQAAAERAIAAYRRSLGEE